VRARDLVVGLLASLLAFLAASSFAIWEDGTRYAETLEEPPPPPHGVATASYLDADRSDWKTADELHEYARDHRLALVERMEGGRTP
jgi:hypothetical protein